MALKRGVVFSENPKVAFENEIKKEEITKEKNVLIETVEILKYFFWNHEMKIARIILTVISTFFIAIQLVNYIDVYHTKKSKKENGIEKIETIQEEINKLSTDMKKIKTYKTSKKMRIKMEKHLHFKIDSLAMVRENLINQ
jgi:hypothetical protein